jgi:hypothetical protein
MCRLHSVPTLHCTPHFYILISISRWTITKFIFHLPFLSNLIFFFDRVCSRLLFIIIYFGSFSFIFFFHQRSINHEGEKNTRNGSLQHYGYARISLLNSEETTVSLKYGTTFWENRTAILRTTTFMYLILCIFTALDSSCEFPAARTTTIFVVLQNKRALYGEVEFLIFFYC